MGGKDPKDRSNFFMFFLKFGLACRKIEASQGFYYQGVGANMLFRNSLPPSMHNNRCRCYSPFSINFPAIPPPKLGHLWKKVIFLGSSLKGLSAVWISFNLKELENMITFLRSHTRQNNRTIGVKKFQLFDYTNYIVGYNCAKFDCLASLVFELAGGGVKMTLQKTPQSF